MQGKPCVCHDTLPTEEAHSSTSTLTTCTPAAYHWQHSHTSPISLSGPHTHTTLISYRMESTLPTAYCSTSPSYTPSLDHAHCIASTGTPPQVLTALLYVRPQGHPRNSPKPERLQSRTMQHPHVTLALAATRLLPRYHTGGLPTTTPSEGWGATTTPYPLTPLSQATQSLKRDACWHHMALNAEAGT